MSIQNSNYVVSVQHLTFHKPRRLSVKRFGFKTLHAAMRCVKRYRSLSSTTLVWLD